MNRRIILLAVTLGTGACGSDRETRVAVQDSLARDLELPPTQSLAPVDSASAGGAVRSSRHDSIGERRTEAGAQARPEPLARARSERAPTRAPARAKPRAATPPQVTASRPVVPSGDTALADTAVADATPADTTSPVGYVPPATDRADTTAMVTSDSAAPAPPSVPTNVLPVGTVFRAQMQDSINSLRNSEGQTVTATVSGDVRARDGLTVLPTGATVHVQIARLRPARSRSAKDGELELRVDSITVAGHTYVVRADVGPVPHELRGRGVTAGEVEKVGAGAAAGAVVGGVVTGKTRGAVIGGVIGAAGGTVVAAQTASRDVVVTPGTLLTLVLRQPVTRATP